MNQSINKMYIPMKLFFQSHPHQHIQPKAVMPSDRALPSSCFTELPVKLLVLSTNPSAARVMRLLVS